MIKVALIGAGKMGISHLAILGAHPDVEIAGVCDTSSMVTDFLTKYAKYNCFSDYKKMVDAVKPDAVVVAVPTKFHYSIIKDLLDRNINVFSEKPFCLKASESEELTKTALAKNLVNQVGYHNHFIGTFVELKRLLKANILGELVHFTGEAYGPVVTKEKGGTWRSKPEEGGGCLYDYASHVLNLLQEVVGRPVKAGGTILKSIYSNGVEDAVYSLLTLQSGVSGVISVNWSDETYRKMSTSLTLQGKKGKIICDATEIKIYLKEANEAEKLDKGWTIKYITDFALPVDFYLRGEEYSAQLDNFVACLVNKKQSQVNTFEQGSYTDKVIAMIIADSKK